MDSLFSEQTVGALFFFLLLLIFVSWFAKSKGFFTLPPPTRRPPVTWIYALGAFLVYLVVALIVVPLLLVLVAWPIHGSIHDLAHASIQVKGWVQLGGLLILFLLLLGYCYLIAPETRKFIFWGESPGGLERLRQCIKGGVIGLVVSYPFVLFFSALTNKIAVWIWGETPVEQVAVNQLKMLTGYPVLFTATALVVTLLVPFMEELLFRGFLQNFLKRHLGRAWAIPLTAVTFALVHFAQSQGRGNFQLIISLLALAFFLSFVFEKYRSLWASVTLHASFNAINIIAIFFSSK